LSMTVAAIHHRRSQETANRTATWLRWSGASISCLNFLFVSALLFGDCEKTQRGKRATPPPPSKENTTTEYVVKY
jgi:hypothetical protein